MKRKNIKNPPKRGWSSRGGLRRAAGLLLVMSFASCYARPTSSDVQRTKETFLRLRLENAIRGEARKVSDEQLFEMSCIQNRVQCSLVLKELEKTDPDFYSRLPGEKSDAAIDAKIETKPGSKPSNRPAGE